jgi:hypothetical protein
MPTVKRTPRTPSESSAPVADQAKPTRERVGPRVPFGGFRRRLEVTSLDPNYYYYWQKNTADNIARMQEAGYEFVSKRDAQRYTPEVLEETQHRGGNESVYDRCERFGGTDAHGDEYNLVLMRQPMKWHQEDMAEHEARNAAVDQAMYRQEFANDPGDSSERYGDINVTVKHEE